MSRIARIFVLGAASFILPGIAFFFGVQGIERREHPALIAPMSWAEIAAAPRPAIDPTKPTVVVLLGRDLTEITDALGPYEMFARAGKYNVVMAASERQPTLLTGGLRILPHYSLAEIDSILAGPASVVVIPNLPNAGHPVNRPVIDWIRQQAHAGALIHSWCKGAMALAETGLLDGQTATAHWGDIDGLEKRYPAVKWIRGVRWIDRGQYVMSAGITSGIDASLRVLIRIAGDSVAQRVAREIRYPNYHFAIDPTVEQYELRAADAVLYANAAFRLSRPRVGIALYDGVAELDLSNVYDAHVHTMVVEARTIAATTGPVITAHGLTLYPSHVITQSNAGSLYKLLVPGTEARNGAAALTQAVIARAPLANIEYLHADEPKRFGLEPVIEHLARMADAPTARFALRRMEFRSTNVDFRGPSLPLVPILTSIALAGAGFGLAWAFIGLRFFHSGGCPKLSESRRTERSRAGVEKSYVRTVVTSRSR
jgi:AraC family transcriptional regulator, transcriptional activator FtrA